jgi:uncharacterized membrane protein YkvA (DUF1232 family)
MANNGRASIVQSIQEIGSIVGARIQQKAAQSPLVTSLAQGAAARVRAVTQRPVAPAEVVSVTDRGPEVAAAPAEPSDGVVSDGFKAFASNIPRFGRLLWKLAGDPRVPTRHKIVLGAAAAYLVSPYDILPDHIPGIGQLDDFAVVVSALDVVLNRTPSDVVHSHWTGDPKTLDSIRRAVGLASQLRAGNLRRWLLRNGA